MAKKDLIPLVIAAQQGDSQALSELLEASYQELYFYAYQTVKNEDLAADITQESCLEILTTLDKLREPGAFVVWARRITYHQCTKYFRESKEVTVTADEEGETIFDRVADESEDALPEQVQLDKEFRATMQQLLDELPAAQRSALMLYYYEKLSVTQIAQIQDTTEGTVKSRLNYGRKAVKNKVEAYEKRTGVRLHSIAPLPLLLYFLFGSECAEVLARCAGILEGIRAALTGTAAAGTAAAAGAGAAAAGGTAAGTAAGAAAGTATAGTAAAALGTGLGVKIAAGVVAAAVCIGGAVGGASLLDKASSNPSNIEIPTEFLGTWYGDEYTEADPSDCYTLNEDGTLEIGGRTYMINGITDFDETSAEGYPYAETFFLHFSYAGEFEYLSPEGNTDLNLSYSWNNCWSAPDYEVTVYIQDPDAHEAQLDRQCYSRTYAGMFAHIPLGASGFYLDTATLVGPYYRTLASGADDQDHFSLDETGILQYGGQTYYLCYIRPNYSFRQGQSEFLGFTLSYSLDEDKHYSWDDTSVDLTLVHTWHGDSYDWQWHAQVLTPAPSGKDPMTAQGTYQLIWDTPSTGEVTDASTVVESPDISMLYGQWNLVDGNHEGQYPDADTLTMSEDGTLIFAGEVYCLTYSEMIDQPDPIPDEYLLYFRKDGNSQDPDPELNAELLLICVWDTSWGSAGYYADVLFPVPNNPGDYQHNASDPSYAIEKP